MHLAQRLFDELETRKSDWLKQDQRATQRRPTPQYTAITKPARSPQRQLSAEFTSRPFDVLGRRPSNPTEARRWDQAVCQYGAVRVSLRPDADLTDLSTPEARQWRTAVDAYHLNDAYHLIPDQASVENGWLTSQ